MFDFFKKKKNQEQTEEVMDEQSVEESAEQDIESEVEAENSQNEPANPEDEQTDSEQTDSEPDEIKEEQEISEPGETKEKQESSEPDEIKEEQAESEPEKIQDEASDEGIAVEQEETESTEDSEKQEKPEKEKGFFNRLKAGLTKTRNSINQSFDQLFSGFSSIDDDFYDELEETLIMADLGLDTTERIIEELKDLVKKNHIKEVEACRELVINLIKDQMYVEDSAYDFENQKTVMLIIGVNGVGKTTSIGKLAAQYKNQGKRVMLCAADTFRAAAIDQLKTWSNRAGVEIISQNEGSDPAAVTFDAVKAANARDVDILLVDTAGRLHNKKNLMDELAKMKRIIEKEYSDAHLETLIVLDGSTGQNALEQARQFSTVTNIDGIILTKLDGTAKGGIAIAIQSELNVPVKYIGVGEQINDLQKFDPESYVNALFADMDTRTELEILIPEDKD